MPGTQVKAIVAAFLVASSSDLEGRRAQGFGADSALTRKYLPNCTPALGSKKERYRLPHLCLIKFWRAA